MSQNKQQPTPTWVTDILLEMNALRRTIDGVKTNQEIILSILNARPNNNLSTNQPKPIQKENKPTNRQPTKIVGKLKLQLADRIIEADACYYHHRFGAGTIFKCDPKCEASKKLQEIMAKLKEPKAPLAPIKDDHDPPAPQLSDSSTSDSEADEKDWNRNK